VEEEWIPLVHIPGIWLFHRELDIPELGEAGLCYPQGIRLGW